MEPLSILGFSIHFKDCFFTVLKEETMITDKKTWYVKGLRHGVPIALGYFAVSFALGIQAKRVGLSAFQATLFSALCNASAGEYAGFTVMAANAPYIEMVIITLIVNARYMLMSATLSQKIDPGLSLQHRLRMGYCVTDEIFGASATVPGTLNPYYTYGLATSALSFWALGTCMGVILGNIFPAKVSAALSISLYGMFLAIIIPPARKNKVILGFVVIAMLCSYGASILPVIGALSEGTRIILLTLVLSLAAALLFPVPDEDTAEG